ncbi:MAG: Ig-like domain-containing protein, partial [Candidatus Methanofastidiosia archaeon]
FTVTLTVTDDDGATGEDTLTVHVSLPNSPPVIGQISAIPAYVPNTGLSTSKLTAQVSDVDDNLLSVYIDLTSIGKDALTPMRDDGVYPDDVASDGIFTVVTSVAPGTEVGQKILSVTATDTMGAQGVGTIILNVVKDPPDNPPTLTSESVTPTSGTTTTNFRYEVTYTDQDNNPPSYVDISIDGGAFVAMTEMDSTDYNYMDGKQYYYDTTGLSVGDHSYNIRTSDGTNPVSIGANGPSVSGANTPPELSNASVTPVTGTTSTNFHYEVTYTDADNDDPVQMDLIIVDSASTCTGGSPCVMTKVDPSDTDYTDGVIYYYEYTNPWGSAGTKSYTINTSDGIDTDSLGGTGPEITSSANTPPELSNASVTPTSGTTTTNFRYEVTYTDADNDDPTLGANGVQIVIEAVTYDMVPEDPSDTDYTDGAIFYYEYTATWGSTGTKSYTINTSDGTDTDSLGGTGPEITSDPNTAPQLSSYSVTPSCGNTSTVFIYEVTFTDADNDNPDYGGSVTGVQIDIDGGGFVDMSEMDTSDTTYSDGKEYYYVYSTGLGIGGHSYTIRTGDGTDTTSIAGTGPEIPTGDCAPPTPPSIAIAPTSGYVGTTVTVTGVGFYSNERHITVTFSGSKVNLTPIGGTSPDDNGTVKADASGSFSATFAVPSSSAGSKSVDAYGDSTSASSIPNRTFTVILPYPYYPPTPPPYIPPGGGSGGGSPSDKVAPETQITQPKNGEVLSGTFYVIKGTASDDQSGVKKVEVSTDGGLTWNLTTGTTSWSYRWTLPTDGIYIIKAKATDNKGNEEESVARVTVTIDNSSPIVEILNLENNTLLSGLSHQMTGTAMDNGEVSKVEVSTDGGITWQPADSTESWSFLWTLGADSSYVVKVRARDKAGNVEITEGITVIVDNTPPKSSINLVEGQEITEESIVITGTATDANGVKLVEVSTDGGVTWLPVRGTTSWSYEWHPPEDGNYTIVVRATDMALNQVIGQSVNVVTELPGGFRVNWKIFAMIGAGVILGLGLVLLYLYYRR